MNDNICIKRYDQAMVILRLIVVYDVSILVCVFTHQSLPGPRLNIKTVLSTYGDFHVKDKTAVRTSYL